MDLLTKLLSKDLDARPASVEQILAHKFFSAPVNDAADMESLSSLEDQFRSLVKTHCQQA